MKNDAFILPMMLNMLVFIRFKEMKNEDFVIVLFAYSVNELIFKTVILLWFHCCFSLAVEVIIRNFIRIFIGIRNSQLSTSTIIPLNESFGAKYPVNS